MGTFKEDNNENYKILCKLTWYKTLDGERNNIYKMDDA